MTRPYTRHKDPKTSVRRTLDWKLKQRQTQNLARGNPADWASEALDAYLDGMPVADIAKVFDVSRTSVSTAVAKEALFRLMRQRQAERLEEMNLGGNEP